jgi:hypothetical protein
MVASFIAAALLAGCSSLPTAPQNNNSPAAMARQAALATADAPIVTASASRTVNGLLGGVVHAGSFTAVIAPGAWFGTKTVTLTQPDVTKLECELHLDQPVTRFLTPVLLTADASSIPKSLISVSYIAWLNPATDRWESRFQSIKQEVLSMALDLDAEGGPQVIQSVYPTDEGHREW